MNNSFILYIKGCGIFARQFPYCKMFIQDMSFSTGLTYSCCNIFSGSWCFWGLIFNNGNFSGIDYSNHASKQFNGGKVR